jgi:hypothetical protein
VSPLLDQSRCDRVKGVPIRFVLAVQEHRQERIPRVVEVSQEELNTQWFWPQRGASKALRDLPGRRLHFRDTLLYVFANEKWVFIAILNPSNDCRCDTTSYIFKGSQICCVYVHCRSITPSRMASDSVRKIAPAVLSFFFSKIAVWRLISSLNLASSSVKGCPFRILEF